MLIKPELDYYFSSSPRFSSADLVNSMTLEEYKKSHGQGDGEIGKRDKCNLFVGKEKMEICSVIRLAEVIMPNITASMQEVQVRRLGAVVVAVHAELSKRDAKRNKK